MFIFLIRDMRVSSQAEAVLEAVNHVDVYASVSINLLAHEVRIASRTADATDLSDAIAQAGFDPVLRDCGCTVLGPGQTAPKIPFEGSDHDFSATTELTDERNIGSVAGARKGSSLFPAEALGPLSR
jgi:copper chaperone CopZ